MSTASVRWEKSEPGGMFLNLTGNLTPSGAIWSGNVISPHHEWQVNIAASGVTANVNPPEIGYDLHMGNINIAKKSGPPSGYEMYADGFGVSSWGSAMHPPAGAQPPYLPRSWKWPVKIVSKTGGATPPGWEGYYWLTLTWATSPTDLATWRYSFDLVVNTPAP